MSKSSPNQSEMATIHRRRRNAFTAEEDALLMNLVFRYGICSWELVASKMLCRNARQCRERFQSYLMPGINNGPWTEMEDKQLEDLYQKHGPKWSKIAKFFPNRNSVNIKNRWNANHRKATEKKQKQENQPPAENASDDEELFYFLTKDDWPLDGVKNDDGQDVL